MSRGQRLEGGRGFLQGCCMCDMHASDLQGRYGLTDFPDDKTSLLPFATQNGPSATATPTCDCKSLTASSAFYIGQIVKVYPLRGLA